jgi:exodeoxyribonuclease III
MIKIYSWNVNGIRAVQNKGLWEPFLAAEQPDILCLQEIKAKPEQIAVNVDGYEAYWFSAEKPGYSGTAILSKVKPLRVINGFPQDIIDKYKVTGDTYGDPNLEGRVVAAEFDKFWVVTVYTPNAKDDLSRVTLRHDHWDPAFLAYCQQLERSKPVVFCGDLNVAHTEDDLANPKPNRGTRNAVASRPSSTPVSLIRCACSSRATAITAGGRTSPSRASVMSAGASITSWSLRVSSLESALPPSTPTSSAPTTAPSASR